MSIPFNRPFIVGKEIHNIADCIMHGSSAGDGRYTKLCSQWMQNRFDAKSVLLTTSCTSALEMAAILCDISEGDEVIMPSYTFVSTANAFLRMGAKIVFCEIRSDTLNIDESKIESLISERTKAIVPVHYAGVSAEMNKIMELAAKYDLKVIEDAAQGVNAKYYNEYLGTIGHLGCYSFHETKNFICGEGGALVVNDEQMCERAHIIREKGTNRKQFFEGAVDKYTWVDIGSSFLPSDILAAFLYAQLEESEKITRKRRQIYNYYYKSLKELDDNGFLKLPFIPKYCEGNAHMFYVVVNNKKSRNSLLEFLKVRQIHAVFHYVPLHSSPMGQDRKNSYFEDLSITEDISERLIRLPCFYDLTEDQQSVVVSAIFEFFKGATIERAGTKDAHNDTILTSQ